MQKALEKIANRYKALPVSVRAALWFMVCNVIQKGISVITTPLFTRLLTTDEYGQYTIFQSWLSIFTLVCTFRLSYSVFTKGMSKFPNERDEYTASTQTTMTIITTIVLVVYLLFHGVIDRFTDMGFIMTLAMFAEVYFAQSIILWSLRHRYEFHYQVIIFPTLLLAFLTPTVGLIAVKLSSHKGDARILAGVAVQVVIGIVFYIINVKKSRRLINWTHAKFAMRFNLSLIPHYLSTYILDQADRIMIQKMCSYSYAAIYGVAYQAGSLMRIVTDAINNSIEPWLYHSLEKKRFKDIEKYVIAILMVIIVICIFFISLAPELIYIFGGSKYAEAIYVIPPVAASMFFTFFFSIISNIEFYYDCNMFTMYVSIIGAVLNVILNFIFIRIYGFIAAGYTTLFCYTFFGIAHYMFMTYMVRRKAGRIIIHPSGIAALSIALITVTISMNYLYKHMIIRYIIVALLCILGFAFRKKIFGLLLEGKRIRGEDNDKAEN